jgi:tetratricopeptide (TPR) repeat protein
MTRDLANLARSRERGSGMDAQLARMLKKVKQGKAVLFLGAGASSAAGCPSGDDLAKMIHEEFLPDLHFSSTDLIEICGQVLDTPGIDRHALEEFIRRKLDAQPSPSHIALCTNKWQAIFTTNFDDIIETAYRITPSRAQRCEPIYGRDFSRTQSDYVDVVRLFKLMGSITGRDNDSTMALSRSDYNRKLRQRGALFRLLFDFVKDGTIVYIGYSFRDRLARDIIDEVVDEVGAASLPWAWALLQSCDSATEQLLRQRKILPLKMTFEEFAKTLQGMPEESGGAGASSTVTVTVAGVPVDIPEVDLKMYRQQFDFLHDGKQSKWTKDQSTAQRDFLEGKTDPWVGISEGWAFRRSATQTLRHEISKNLKSQSDHDVPILTLTGPASSGKTTLARLLAHDIYREEGLPCIMLRPEREQIDFLVIDSFVRHLVVSISAVPKTPTRLPILIVVDDAASKSQDIRRLAQYMRSRGNPAVVLAVARENEWALAQGDHPIKTVGNTSLPDMLAAEKSEPILLIKHLRSLGVLVSPRADEYWEQLIKDEYDNSFQTALYYLAEPTRPPLSSSIRDEYDRLMPLAKQAYRYVCIFYQFGLPLDLELLARSLQRSYEDFVSSVYDPASLGVIIDDKGTPDVIRFRARSRLVAELMIGYAYADQSEWLADLQRIIGSLLPQNANEVETLRTVLIRLGGRGEKKASLPVASLKPLFRAALSAGMHDSATLHHFALLLLDENEFVEAQRYLADAIEVVQDPNELSHFKLASRQHMYNSMGMVAAKYGLRLEKSGNAEEAERQFQQAVVYFRAARTGFFPNSYPFYSESWMLYTRARNVFGIARLHLLAEALQVLDEADGNVAEDEKASLQEMEAKIVQYLADIPNVQGSIDLAAAEGDMAMLYLQARRSSGLHANGYDATSAYAIVVGALGKAPEHIPCLRLASRLHRKLFPIDWEGWWKLLKRRYDLEGSRGGCDLLFELGYAYCELGKYPEAARHFDELDGESNGHPLRSGIVKVITDGEAQRRFTGIVKSVPSRFEGWIRSDLVGAEIKCVPVKQKFTITTGQTVTFGLALNYRGFLAIDVRPS